MDLFPELPKESRICAKILTQTSIGVSCYDCSLVASAIYCIDCFDFSKHTDHRFFIKTKCNGCCDCGDEECLTKETFCSSHSGCEIKLDIPEEVREKFCAQWETLVGQMIEEEEDASFGLEELNKVRLHCVQSIAYCHLLGQVLAREGLLLRLLRKAKSSKKWAELLLNLCIALLQQNQFLEHCTLTFMRNYEELVDSLGNLTIQLFNRPILMERLFASHQIGLQVVQPKWQDSKMQALINDLVLICRKDSSARGFLEFSFQTYFQFFTKYVDSQQQKLNVKASQFQDLVLSRILAKGVTALKSSPQLLISLVEAVIHSLSNCVYVPNSNFLLHRSYFLLLLAADRFCPELITKEMLVVGVLLVDRLALFLHICEVANSKVRVHPEFQAFSQTYESSFTQHVDRSFLRLLCFKGAKVKLPCLKPTLNSMRVNLLTRVSLSLDSISQLVVNYKLGVQSSPSVLRAVKLTIRTILAIQGKKKCKELLSFIKLNSQEEEQFSYVLLSILDEIADCKDGYFSLREQVEAPDPFRLAYSVKTFNGIEHEVKDRQYLCSPSPYPLHCKELLNLKALELLKLQELQPPFEQQLANQAVKCCEVAMKVTCLSKRKQDYQLLKEFALKLIGKGVLTPKWEENLAMVAKAVFQEQSEGMVEQAVQDVKAESKKQATAEAKAQLKSKAGEKRKKLRVKLQQQRESIIVEGECKENAQRAQCLICREELDESRQFGVPVLIRLSNLHNLSAWREGRPADKVDLAQIEKLVESPFGIDLWTCRHKLHEDCFFSLHKKDSRCPLCKTESNMLLPLQVKPDKVVESLESLLPWYLQFNKPIPLPQQFAVQTLALAAHYFELDSESFLRERQQPYRVITGILKQYVALNMKERMAQLKSRVDNQRKQEVIALLLGEQLDQTTCSPGVLALAGLSGPMADAPASLLIKLPATLKQFHRLYAAEKCQLCSKYRSQKSIELTKCLICGLILCNISCAQKQSVGNLNLHAEQCHGGSCVFLGLHSLKQYFVSTPHNSKSEETLYVDQHGRNYDLSVAYRDKFRLNYGRCETLESAARRNSYHQFILARELAGTIFYQLVY